MIIFNLRKTNLFPRVKIFISKNIALIYYDILKGPCFYLLFFCISYIHLRFYLQEVAMKKLFFHHSYWK